MNLRRSSDTLKALPLFGVLLLCGIDLDTPPAPGHEVVARHEAMLACEQDAQCVTDAFWNQDLMVSQAD